MKLKMIVAAASVAALVTACQTAPYQPYARDVKKKPNQSGVVALKLEHRDEDRAKAATMMESNCRPSPVKILEEGEVVIGQESTTNANTSKSAGTSSKPLGTFLGLPITSTGSNPSESTTAHVSTQQLKEWQISYECSAQKKSAAR